MASIIKNFFSIKTLSGENYFGRMVQDPADADTVELEIEDGQQVIKHFTPVGKWLLIRDVFIMVPTQTGMIPVEFSKMPMGNNRQNLQVEHITEINVLDEKSQFVKALENIKSGLVTEAPAGVKNSSRKEGALVSR